MTPFALLPFAPRHARLIALALAALLAAPLAMAAAPEAGSGEASPPGTSAADRLDDDLSARYIPLPIKTTTRAAKRDRLRAVDRGLERFPNHPLLLKERGFIRHQRGEADLAEADYALALDAAGSDVPMRRHVLWSQGWARFEAGKDEAALASWREAKALHGGRPYWFGYTAALAAWRLGRRDEAIALFDEVVRGMPVWGTERGFAQRTVRWPRHQINVGTEVFTAWRAANPQAFARAQAATAR